MNVRYARPAGNDGTIQVRHAGTAGGTIIMEALEDKYSRIVDLLEQRAPTQEDVKRSRKDERTSTKPQARFELATSSLPRTRSTG